MQWWQGRISLNKYITYNYEVYYGQDPNFTPSLYTIFLTITTITGKVNLDQVYDAFLPQQDYAR